MAVASIMHRPRRLATRSLAARRPLRLDPPNPFAASGIALLREPQRPEWIESSDPSLVVPTTAPLASPPKPAPRISRAWGTTIFASIALHVAVAAFFMWGPAGDEVLIAGADAMSPPLLGNASEDSLSQGDPLDLDTTKVTIVPLTTARPVETIAAEAVDTVSEIENIEPVEVAELAPAPARQQAVQPPAPLTEVTPDVVAPQAAPTEQAAEPTAGETLPALLATDTVEEVTDDNVVAPVAASPEPPRPVEQPPAVISEAAPTETVEETPVERAAPAVAKTVAEQEPPLDRVVESVVEADPIEEVAELPEEWPVDPKPEPRPTPVQPRKSEPVAENQKARPAKAATKPAPAKASGSKGKGPADAAKGTPDGARDGVQPSMAGKGKAKTVGNAAVTNYPGKVRQRLSSAVRRIPSRDRAKAERDVHIAFTVTASGGLGGVSIVRSSGSTALDQAAVAAVRRAAPFPPIPDGAGRSSWNFTFPLGLAR